MTIISRTAVYGIATQGNQFLLVKQRKGPHAGKWDLPGGGIEPGETIEEALRREFSEEVAMAFDSMRLFANLTAVTPATNEKGTPYSFHQIGLIYLISGLAPLTDQLPEMEYSWLDPKSLEPEMMSPLLRQVCQKLIAE